MFIEARVNLPAEHEAAAEAVCAGLNQTATPSFRVYNKCFVRSATPVYADTFPAAWANQCQHLANRDGRPAYLANDRIRTAMAAAQFPNPIGCWCKAFLTAMYRADVSSADFKNDGWGK